MSNTRGATILAIDVGTGSLKAAVSEPGGKLLSTANAPVPYLPVDEDAPFSRAFDVEALWPAIVDVARRALRDAGVRNGSVAAVGVTSQRQGIGALDADGKELFLGPNMDLRALFEGLGIDEDHADMVYRLTGHLPSFMLAPAKLRWRKLYEPESYERIAAVVTVGDWVGYRLTGELAMQETLASEAGLLDISSGTLAASLLETLGLRTDCFPPITPTGGGLGGLTSAVAEQLGLSPGVPVVVAGPDTQCGLLAMGVASPGDTGVVAGWSVTAQSVTGAPQPDEARRTWVGRHVVPGSWVAEANAGDGGNAYRWLLELLVGAEDGGFERMEALAAEAPPGAEGAWRCSALRRWTCPSRGYVPADCCFPCRSPSAASTARGWPGLRWRTWSTPCAELRTCSPRSQGAPSNGLAVGGGMTRTALFPQLLADVVGRPIHVALTPDVSLQGAALAAEAALEGGDALRQLAQAARLGLREVTPDPVAQHEYREHYDRWLDAQRRLEGFL